MLNHFLVTAVVLSNLLGLSLPQAIEEAQQLYLAPTIVDEFNTGSFLTQEFEWRAKEKFRTKAQAPIPLNNDKDAEINANTALIMDTSTKQVLWQKNPDDAFPIASITKLMTALIWLDNKPKDSYDHIHTMAKEEDTPEGKELNLPEGTQLTAGDLLNIALTASNNDIAMALAHTTSLSNKEFVEKMNDKADALGMTTANFADQTGLDTRNTATSLDIAKLALEAFDDLAIVEATSQPDYAFKTIDSRISRRVYTTNKLLFDEDIEIVAAKTGYLVEAGYCLVVKVKVPGSDRTVIAVILGANSDEERFSEMKNLLNWTFSHYAWN